MTTQGGRPAYRPTEDDRETVTSLASYGVPQDDIAAVLRVDGKTLRKHFRAELDLAATQANAKVAQSLFQRATDPEGGGPGVTAAIFWMKARAGWTDRVKVDMEVTDNTPRVEIYLPDNGRDPK